MSVKIRLARHGAKKAPYYRVVVADSRSPRDGRIIEEVGRYNPNTDPSIVTLDMEKVDKWLADGAQPTDTVAKLIDIARGDAPEFKEAEKKPSKKAQAKAAAEAEAAAEAAEAAEAEEAAPAEEA